jgi:hypothetical protein
LAAGREKCILLNTPDESLDGLYIWENGEMRRLLLTVVVCVGFALSANAETISGGKVTAVNAAARSFDCHWRTKDWTFKTNDKTIIKVGKKIAAWSEVKAGQTVNIKFHQEGDVRVADRVVLTLGTGF